MFVQNFLVSFPLFALVGLGFFCTKIRLVNDAVGNALSRYAFVIAIPVLLFNIMSNIRNLPPPNWWIGLAFFGACFIVFGIGYFLAARILHLTSEQQILFAIGGIFPNDVQLGIPIAIALLGEEVLPSIAIIFFSERLYYVDGCNGIF